MRYRITLVENGKIIHRTSLRFHDWNSAQWFIEKVLRYKNFRKNEVEAKIIAANGLPF